MPLNATQKEVVLEWLSARASKGGCPCCGGDSFSIENELAMLPFVGYKPDQGNVMDQSRCTPMVVLVCNDCANIRFFEARRIGVAR